MSEKITTPVGPSHLYASGTPIPLAVTVLLDRLEALIAIAHRAEDMTLDDLFRIQIVEDEVAQVKDLAGRG